jgi:hypothetical protein
MSEEVAPLFCVMAASRNTTTPHQVQQARQAGFLEPDAE